MNEEKKTAEKKKKRVEVGKVWKVVNENKLKIPRGKSEREREGEREILERKSFILGS